MTRPNWMARAACIGHDPELWFPNAGHKPSTDVVAICRSCPVINECLDYGLTHGLKGVWGATGEEQRKRIRRTKP
jgi:WhiB family redox-sensing transcriptional regulator